MGGGGGGEVSGVRWRAARGRGGGRRTCARAGVSGAGGPMRERAIGAEIGSPRRSRGSGRDARAGRARGPRVRFGTKTKKMCRDGTRHPRFRDRRGARGASGARARARRIRSRADVASVASVAGARAPREASHAAFRGSVSVGGWNSGGVLTCSARRPTPRIGARAAARGQRRRRGRAAHDGGGHRCPGSWRVARVRPRRRASLASRRVRARPGGTPRVREPDGAPLKRTRWPREPRRVTLKITEHLVSIICGDRVSARGAKAGD